MHKFSPLYKKTLIVASRDLPLHHYPTHALSVLGTDLSLLPTLMSWEHSKRTYRLRQFALSHSRMVLMLQNLVHSTTELVSSEFHSNEDTEQRRAIDPKSKFNSIPKLQSPIYPQKGGPRELTFPKPLSYSPSSFTGSDSITRKSRPSSANGFGSSSSSATSSENGLAKLEDSGRQQRLRHSRKWGSEEVTSSPNPTSRLTKTKSSVLLGSSSTKSESRINNNGQISPVASSSSSLKRKSNRLSIFASVKSRSQAPLPKPEEEPESLRIYSGNWRKSRQSIISPSARASQHVLANGSTGSPYVQSTPPRNRESRIPAALPRTRSDSISAASYSQSCEQGLSPDSIVEGEDEELQPPRRRFVTESGDRRGSSSSPSPSSVGTSRYSSSSSLGSVVSIGQGNASSSPSRFAVRGSPLGIGGSASSVRTDSKSLMRVGRRRDVHDLMSATVRSRAPILRVFVPCSSLSSRTAKRAGSAWEEGETEEEDDIIAKIENELVDAGLWDHLSVGDVVCNLGYVPLEFGPERGRGRGRRKEDTESNHTGTEIDAQQDTEEGEGTRWLIYTGTQLAVYDPFSTVERDALRMAMGSVPLRGEEVLGLPSPFYFSHLTSIPTAPSAGVEVNTVLRLPVSLLTFLSVRNNEQVIMNTPGEGMGIERREESVKYWLEETTVRVRSRAGYGIQGQGKGKYGYIAVRTHAWLVSFHVAAASSVNVGSGWAGEWVLQSEGTPEGRARLEEVVFGSGDRRRKTEREVVVEIVREKCRGGKLWLR